MNLSNKNRKKDADDIDGNEVDNSNNMEEESNEMDDDAKEMVEEEFMENERDKNDYNDAEDVDDEDAASDAEDFLIKNTDKVLLIANTEDDFSALEMHIYDEETGSFYVHHDITLPSFPLCISWIGCDSNKLQKNSSIVTTKPGNNFAAVGTFNTTIEIWNLDILDILEPTVILGEPNKPKSKSSKSKKSKSSEKRTGHNDAVLSLSWNAVHPSLLLSGSADKTVKLWDLSTATCVHTFKHHSSEVSTVAWNPVEASIALSGSFDKTVAIFDARQAAGGSAQVPVAKFPTTADVEKASWDPHHPSLFVVASEDGSLRSYDVRTGPSKPLYHINPHKKSLTGVAFNPIISG